MLSNKLCLSELSSCNVKTPLMLPDEQKPDWYTIFSEAVFATSIPMILEWGKNTKSTKTLLIDYLWEQQAILKRKRIKLKTYESILTWKFFFCCPNILYDVHVCQIRLLCYFLKVSKVLNYCGWFCKFFWYWWQVLLVSFRCWLLSSFRQPPW